MRLANKTALITGGNSGIGLATAKLFVAEGARVVITGRNQATLEAAAKELGPNALAIVADATDIAATEAAIKKGAEKFGKLDIVFANAGIAGGTPLGGATLEAFEKVISTNLTGVFFTVQAALPHLNDDASIILNGSVVENDRGVVVEMRQRGLHGEEHAGEVGADDLFKGLERGGAKRRAARDTGVGEHDVVFAELVGSLRERGFGGGDVGGVGHHRERVWTEFPGGGIEGCLIPPCDDDLGALGHEHSCGRKTDAAVATCNQRRLVREPHGRLQWLHY